MSVPRFQLVSTEVKNVQIQRSANKQGRMVASGVVLNDEQYAVTDRFWTSVRSLYGFSDSIFKYFSDEEVFNRIGEVEKDDRIRVCVEETIKEDGTLNRRLLAATKPGKAIIPYDALTEMLEKYPTFSMKYADGVVESTHAPTANGGAFQVAGDAMENRFVMQTPIDGYGSPNLYLAMLRQVCSNGVIALAKAFRSTLSVGKASDDPMFAISRAIDGFNNDDGFSAFRNRMEASTQSWASVREANSLYRLLLKLNNNGQIGFNSNASSPSVGSAFRRNATPWADQPSAEDMVGRASPIIHAYHGLTGDIHSHYGIANLDGLSEKRQSMLPANCSVYDLINFVSEVATHHCGDDVQGGRMCQAWLGTLIADKNGFDMEGSKAEFKDFADFHIEASLSQGLTGSKDPVNSEVLAGT